MKKSIRIGAVIFFVLLLVLVRAYEDLLFYDPLLEFFKGHYKTQPLPELDIPALLLETTIRFGLNTLFSLAILWFVFMDMEIIKLSAVLYSLFFVLLTLVFWILVQTSEGTDTHFALFYVRRFLIQPLFLFLLLPAFYFQKRKSR